MAAGFGIPAQEYLTSIRKQPFSVQLRLEVEQLGRQIEGRTSSAGNQVSEGCIAEMNLLSQTVGCYVVMVKYLEESNPSVSVLIFSDEYFVVKILYARLIASFFSSKVISS